MSPRAPADLRAPSLLPLESLSTSELVGIIAKRVKRDRGDGLSRAVHEADLLPALGGRSARELHDATGLDIRVAEVLLAGVELGVRWCERSTTVPDAIRSSADVACLLGPRLRLLDHEQLWILALDASSRPIGMRRLAEGGRHGCAVLARDVLRAALAMAASSFVLAHNHPGGDPAPSRHDLHLTRSIARAAAVIGVPLVDHVIVTRAGQASMLDLGFMDPADAHCS